MTTQLEALAKPFGGRLVKAPAPGQHGDYVAHDVVNQRLLAVVGPFTYRVTEVIRNPDGLVDGCIAEMTLTIDGRDVSVAECGECDNPTGKKTNGERLKHASSDAFKRCAMRFGVALHLWAGDDYFLSDLLARKNADA